MNHKPLTPVTQIEETVYSPTDANNGAGPYWCFGSSILVRRGDRLFMSGLDTLPGEVPLHNCRWFLATRKDSDQGWQRIYTDYFNRTREPSPIALTDSGLLYTTANPTLAGMGTYSGPAQPTFHAFDVSQWPPTLSSRHNLIEPIATELPKWNEAALFTEHSYRTLAVDPMSGDALIFNNIGYDYAHWAFRAGDGRWSASGKIVWPRHNVNGKDISLRVCYPSAILRGKAAYFFGISDIQEFDPALAELKFKLTGSKWDYVFCRMFFTYTPDVTTTPFSNWIEIANVEPTRGWTLTGDLHVDDAGAVHMLWYENNVTKQLRDAAFPGVPVTFKSQYARLRNGKIEKRLTLFDFEAGAGAGFLPERPRFHHTPSGRRVVATSGHMIPGGLGERPRNATVMREIFANDSLSEPREINLTRPMNGWVFNSTRRTGSHSSKYLDLIGPVAGSHDCRYARVLLDD